MENSPVDPAKAPVVLPAKIRKFLPVFMLIAGLGFGYAASTIRFKNQSVKHLSDDAPVREGGFNFINPLLECASSDEDLDTQVTSFRDTITSIIKKEQNAGNVSSTSVIFQDLNGTQKFSIAKDEEFIPASLMKLPIALELMKLSEAHPDVLKEPLMFKNTFTFPKKIQTILPSQEITPGRTYTIEDLIQHTLVYSDNQAAALLYADALPALQKKGYLSDTTTDQRVDISFLKSIINTTMDTVTVSNYSKLFNVLYNSSYLNRQNSENVLTMLSRVEYRDALVAGVPSDIDVAHKFGEAGELGGLRQLHDCGIVYFPKHPYLLCIMTKGNKAEQLPNIIKEISAAVYAEVDKQI